MIWVASFVGIAAVVLCANARFVKSMLELRPAAPAALIAFGCVGVAAALSAGWSAWSVAAMAVYAFLGMLGQISRYRYRRSGEGRGRLPAVLSPALAVAPLLLACAAFFLDPASAFGWCYAVCAMLCAILGAAGSLKKKTFLDGAGYALFLCSILLASAEMLYSVTI